VLVSVTAVTSTVKRAMSCAGESVSVTVSEPKQGEVFGSVPQPVVGIAGAKSHGGAWCYRH